MGWLSLLALAVALAMDAFAVAIVTGVTLASMTWRHVFRLAFCFGMFQALMPVLGWLAGTAVRSAIEAFDHWVAFGLLCLVGGKMLWSGLCGSEGDRPAADCTSGWALWFLSVSTSIDALAVGLSLALLKTPILYPSVIIGIVAFLMTAAGMVFGDKLGRMFGKRVEVAGGLILVGIGVKILWDHLA